MHVEVMWEMVVYASDITRIQKMCTFVRRCYLRDLQRVQKCVRRFMRMKILQRIFSSRQCMRLRATALVNACSQVGHPARPNSHGQGNTVLPVGLNVIACG